MRFPSIPKSSAKTNNPNIDPNPPNHGGFESKVTLTFLFELKRDPQIALEFDVWAYQPFAPADFPLTIEVRERENLLRTIPIAVSKESTHEKIQVPLVPTDGHRVIHVTAALRVPPGPSYPPLTCYIRNPAIKAMMPPQ